MSKRMIRCLNAETPAVPAASTSWRRLEPRTLLVHCGWLAAPLGSPALTALATGAEITPGAWITLAVITVIGLIRWARTDFRVTHDSFDVRSGLLTRRLRSVPLHRIRTVDLTASPLHRLMGVTVLRTGTAGSGDGGGELSLEALRPAEADRLRTELLARADTEAAADDPVLARISWRWLRYAPLTFWIVGGVFVVAGSAYRALDAIGIEPWKLGFVRRAFSEFGASVLWLTIPTALLAILALGSVGAVALYVENWWSYRLEWADARTLQVRRGLFTNRSVTIERARLRGVLLREPLLLRAGGGALVRAVAGGLGNREENRRRSGLLPPAPRH
nr:PH domain-containing protein [Streptomyces halobius]